MKIKGFEIRILEIPMRLSVQHALAERRTARNLLVVARDEAGRKGWGESCPRPYVTGETVESAREVLRDRILPLLAGREFQDLASAAALLTSVFGEFERNEQAAFCAAELAVLDLAGKVFGASAGTVLGPIVAPSVRYSGVVAAGDPEGAKTQAGLMTKFGIVEVKVKVGPSLEKNLEILRVVRQVLGEEVELRIDANCAWDGPETVRQLQALAEFRLAGVEQPVPGADIAGMKMATAAKLAPVVADESLASVADAATLIREAACDIFNLRVSKCGGLINCGRLYRMAAEAGLACQLGAQVGEYGFLSAAGRHIGSRCGQIRWAEGSYGRLLLEEDVTDPDVTVGPRGSVPALDSPGLGVGPRMEIIEKYQKEKVVLE